MCKQNNTLSVHSKCSQNIEEKNNYIVKITGAYGSLKTMKQCIHYMLDSGRSVAESAKHHFEFLESVGNYKGSLFLTVLINRGLPVF